MRLFCYVLLAVLAAPAGLAQPFTDITEKLPHLGCYAPEPLAPADYDGDGDADVAYMIWLPQEDYKWSQGTFLLTNTGATEGMLFERMSLLETEPDDAVDTDPEFESRDLLWGDYDNDGDLDLIHGRGPEEPSLVFWNESGTFVPREAGLPPIQRDASYVPFNSRLSSHADYDNDGDLDVFIGSVPGPGGEKDRRGYLMRNDGGFFTVVSDDMPTVTVGNSAWGDYDGDGDRDLLVVQLGSYGLDIEPKTTLLRNDGGVFTDSGVELEAFNAGGATFGDADNDGDLDIISVGFQGHAHESLYVHLNEGGSFTRTTALTFERYEWPMALHWADYNGDGAGDLLVTFEILEGFGEEATTRGAERIYLREGDGYTLAAELPGPDTPLLGSQAWVDLEGDGDLDLLISGMLEQEEGEECPRRVLLFRNDVPELNVAPTAPAAPTASGEGDAVTLSWGAAADDHTPSKALTYNLHVTNRFGSDIVSPMARPETGQRLLAERGNVDHNTAWTLRGLPPGEYTWRVQAVDNAFNGGAFAEGGTFVVGAVESEGGVAVPTAFAATAYPNPAVDRLAVRIDLPEAAEVRVAVYDALGRRVAEAEASLPEGAAQAVPVDITALPSGAYLYRVAAVSAAGVERASGRLTVVR